MTGGVGLFRLQFEMQPVRKDIYLKMEPNIEKVIDILYNGTTNWDEYVFLHCDIEGDIWKKQKKI